MKGDEFWSCEIGDSKTGKFKMDYSGGDCTLWATHGDKTYTLLLPSEMMDRLARTWRQWRELDKGSEEDSA